MENEPGEVKLALKWSVPITLAAMLLAWASEQVALLMGFNPPPQDLVRIFTDPNVAWQVKAKLAAIAVLVAPVVEEIVFRKWLFRICWWAEKHARGAEWRDAGVFPLVSALASGAMFAIVHLHAATFVPLWFLGVAFAWLYWKSGTIMSSMLCHFIFNLVNFSLCLLCVGAQ